jgi:hypothetical protein
MIHTKVVWDLTFLKDMGKGIATKEQHWRLLDSKWPGLELVKQLLQASTRLSISQHSAHAHNMWQMLTA